MNTEEFLNFVLPDEGFRALMVPTARTGGDQFQRHLCYADNASAAAAVATETKRDRDVYYCVSTLREPLQKGKKFRTQGNALQTRALFLDLDVATGPDDPKAHRKYATRVDALQSLQGFCKDVGLPRPLLVASGAVGVHAYWVFEAAVSTSAWAPVAAQFKALCMARQLLMDTAVPADSARVLRPVGAVSFKHGGYSQIITLNPTLPPRQPFQFYADLLQTLAPQPAVLQGPAPDLGGSNTQSRYDGLPVSIERVADHCALVAESLDSAGATDSEPVWYRNLGLAAFCDDPEATATMLASGHPGYDKEETLAKLRQWQEKVSGPPSCESLYEAWYDTPDLRRECQNCPNRGKITTPLQLGRYAPEQPAPVALAVQEDGQVQERQLVNPPFPYIRSGGKILITQRGKDGDPVPPMEICSMDLYPVQLVDHETSGERNVVWRAHLPEGQRDIVIPQRAHYTDPGKLAGELGSRGITLLPKFAKHVQEYMVAYIRTLQRDQRPVAHYTTLGWRDNTFVLPDGVVTPTGLSGFEYPPAFKAELRGIGDSKGTVDAWKQVLAFYNDAAYQPYQMAILTSIGAPLLRYTNIAGVVLSLLGERGTGKSTVLEVINSFWGHPKLLMLNGTERGATLNALFKTISLHNNIPVCYDEISGMHPAKTGELCYNISQGNGRKRMVDGQKFGAEERWSTVLICSTNQSIAAKLAANRVESMAEMMRLIEFRIQDAGVHSKAQADDMIRLLNGNYGHGGKAIMNFVVKNQELVSEKVHAMTKELDIRAQVSSGERFWSAAFAAGLVAGAIMHRLGLITWNLQSLTDFAVEHTTDMRSDLGEYVSTPERLLVSIMEEFGPNTLVVADTALKNNPLTQGNIAVIPLVSPRGPLYVRREQESMRAYLDKRAVRNFCAEQGVDMNGLQRGLLKLGIILDPNANKTLGSGTHFATGNTRCWLVDLKHPLIGNSVPSLAVVATSLPKAQGA